MSASYTGHVSYDGTTDMFTLTFGQLHGQVSGRIVARYLHKSWALTAITNAAVNTAYHSFLLSVPIDVKQNSTIQLTAEQSVDIIGLLVLSIVITLNIPHDGDWTQLLGKIASGFHHHLMQYRRILFAHAS